MSCRSILYILDNHIREYIYTYMINEMTETTCRTDLILEFTDRNGENVFRKWTRFGCKFRKPRLDLIYNTIKRRGRGGCFNGHDVRRKWITTRSDIWYTCTFVVHTRTGNHDDRSGSNLGYYGTVSYSRRIYGGERESGQEKKDPFIGS